MGMSASQARLLSITARISDTELRAQSASNTKIRLSMESEEVSKKYLNALNSKVLKVSTFNDSSGKMQNVDFDVNYLKSNSAKDFLRVLDKDGNDITGPGLKRTPSADEIHYKLYSGEYKLQRKQELEDGTFDWKYDSWQSGNNGLNEVNDDREINQVKAEYDTNMLKIQTKEKKIDLELKNIDTEHSALQTEYDSVKKVIDKNIETSFKMFS